MGTGSFPEVKLPGLGVDHPPHLAPRLKKGKSYTSTAPGLRGLFYRVNLNFSSKEIQVERADRAWIHLAKDESIEMIT
jgi:hypothetical protein